MGLRAEYKSINFLIAGTENVISQEVNLMRTIRAWRKINVAISGSSDGSLNI
ncbi:MAG: hypothetical protein HW384_145 [Dehalococcoidia bacterium]|nr:hypothetical protein [Dehalococcoidia bacterium]